MPRLTIEELTDPCRFSVFTGCIGYIPFRAELAAAVLVTTRNVMRPILADLHIVGVRTLPYGDAWLFRGQPLRHEFAWSCGCKRCAFVRVAVGGC